MTNQRWREEAKRGRQETEQMTFGEREKGVEDGKDKGRERGHRRGGGRFG